MSEGRPDKLLKQLRRNEKELLLFENNDHSPAVEVNKWLETVRNWIKRLAGENVSYSNESTKKNSRAEKEYTTKEEKRKCCLSIFRHKKTEIWEGNCTHLTNNL